MKLSATKISTLFHLFTSNGLISFAIRGVNEMRDIPSILNIYRYKVNLDEQVVTVYFRKCNKSAQDSDKS